VCVRALPFTSVASSGMSAAVQCNNSRRVVLAACILRFFMGLLRGTNHRGKMTEYRHDHSNSTKSKSIQLQTGTIFSERVEFKVPPDAVQVISEAEHQLQTCTILHYTYIKTSWAAPGFLSRGERGSKAEGMGQTKMVVIGLSTEEN